ncbi:GNAT family N-acetyltransferase [Parerythrobacter lacustris]|uniref:GNAT family N-acetyltransferase n=1 Tax=Parerythrobacter lacustris TaxID=2969984 RepID=A0ABT1XWI8_9SPHN|nr:GNAT family N-acetyltransferase [Parerythrobacter lacustris]
MSIRSRPWGETASDGRFLAMWRGLTENAAEPNPFLEPWALLPALESHDAARRCDILTIESGDALIGLIPVARHGLYYRYPLPHLRNWMHGNAFLGTPLVASGQEDAFWTALLEWADERAGSALFLHLSQLDEEGPLLASLRGILADQTRPAAIVHREERALLQSDLGPEAYLAASMSGKKRKELRRQHRRLAEEGQLEFRREGDDTGLLAWTDAFLALEKAGWKGENGSALACDPATANMFRKTLGGAASAGKLERLSFWFDGKPIAMLANFLTPPGAFSYKTAYDESFARFSPGVLLQLENLALLDHPQIDWCDSCASQDHPMIDRIWREKRTIVRVSIAIGGRARQSICRQILRREAGTEMGEL